MSRSEQSNASLLRRVGPIGGRKNPQPKDIYDLVVIGAGPAGLAAADLAARMGCTVAIVERNLLGGTALNSGPIPSKALIASARIFETVRDIKEFGRSADVQPRVDFAAVMERMRRIRVRIAEYHSLDRLTALGVDVFFGDAGFAGVAVLAVDTICLSFKKALIATGAQPKPSDIPGLDEIGYLTSATIFNLETLPKKLAIIGGGPLGCELAQAFCRFGSDVTIIQNDPKFLPYEERDAAELLSMSLSRDGVQTRLNTTVVAAHVENGLKFLDTVNNEVKDSIQADEILLSIGRLPNVDTLNLEKAGIDCAPDRRIKVDDFLRTGNPNVYAAGDVCMLHKFANIAEVSGQIAVQNALGGKRKRVSRLIVPWCTFCDPEIAHVGLHVWQARAQSIPVKTFTVMMQDVDRAITDGQDNGFVKIHVRQGTDQILGASIVATRASELINEMAVIMSARLGMRDLAEIIHTYPAQSEAIRLAAIAYMRDEDK